MCARVCVRACVRVCVCVVSVIVKRPVLPPSVVDGRSRNPLYYYYYVAFETSNTVLSPIIFSPNSLMFSGSNPFSARELILCCRF